MNVLRSVGKNILFLLWTVVVSLILVEGAYRLWTGVPLLALQDFRGGSVLGSVIGSVMYDADLGWSPSPNASVEFSIPDTLIRYKINTIDYGIRRNSRKDHTVRTGSFLAVGDSFTEGSEANDEETWPAQLEAIIQRPVINAGVGGYGSDQTIMRAEKLLPIIRPRVLLVGILDQDILRAGYSSFGAPKPYYSVEDGELRLHNSPVPTIEDAREDKISFLKVFAGYSLVIDKVMKRYDPIGWLSGKDQIFSKTSADEVEVTCLLLKRLKQKAEDYNVRTLLVMQYGGGLITTATQRSGIGQLVEACAGKMGYQIVDEFESLKAIANSDPTEFRNYYRGKEGNRWGHMSPTGNLHIARLVAAALAEPPPTGRADDFVMASPSPGDGQNLFADPEELDKVASSSRIASFQKLNTPSNGPQVYQVAAIGPPGEHYVAIGAGELPPGSYMLSLDARAEGTSNIRIQLLDSQSNGVVGDYNLATNSVATMRAGTAQNLRAGMKDIGDGWRRLWLGATVPGRNTLVLLGLKDSNRRPDFAPQGESYRVRAIKLEGGDRARRDTRKIENPGDGINVIPDPEKLETVVSGGEIASFEAADSAHAPVREYKLTAEGGFGEHFVAVSSLPLRAGTYTLAVQVKPAGTRRMRLQLLDERNNGAIVDYDLRARRAVLTNLASSAKMYGEIRKAEGEWLELSLTATVTGTSRVIIQLMGADGSNGFVPNGDAVLLRAVRLERGETATAYSASRESAPKAHKSRSKKPSDGINLIPAPEGLENVIANSEIASFEPLSAASSPIRAYRLAATDQPTEHFVAISGLALDSGPHTVSMHVKPDGASRMRLQLLDDRNNGAIADYSLLTPGVTLTSLATSESMDADIRKLDDDWLELSLTGSVAGNSRIIIQLLGADGANGFAGKGEAVILRALRLERGETVTPYAKLVR